MKLCTQECLAKNKSCAQTQCRSWIEFKKDLNCLELAIDKYGPLTLKEVGERLGISYVRVTQIEKSALQKLRKKAFIKKNTNYNN